MAKVQGRFHSSKSSQTSFTCSCWLFIHDSVVVLSVSRLVAFALLDSSSLLVVVEGGLLHTTAPSGMPVSTETYRAAPLY